MTTPKGPAAPDGLGSKAARLWRDTVREFELARHELAILEMACRELDDVVRIEAELAKPRVKLIVKGSMGQPVANELLTEVRQHRQSFRQLIASLKLPEPEEEPAAGAATATSRSARAAAAARWSGKRGAA